MDDASKPADQADLIARLKQGMAETAASFPRASEEELSDYRKRMEGAPRLVLADDVALELGPPQKISAPMTLWTGRKDLVRDGAVTLLGQDLNVAGQKDLDFGQAILIAAQEGEPPDPFKLEARQYISDRLPGVMARMAPGRLWLRASKRAIENKVSARLLAAALAEGLEEGGLAPVAIEIIFAVGDSEAARRFAAIASEQKIMAGEHKKIALSADGDYECEELDCDSCDEKPVCDEIREAVTIRRRKKREP